MSQTVQTENKMGIMPIPKLLISMSLPMMISMLVQALYNIVDSMFVAKLCEEALTAVSLAFPIQTLMISVASGTGVGINALLSRNLGEKNFKGANRAARNGIFLGIISCIVFAAIGITCSHAFFSAQTSDPLIVKYGTQYMTIICVMSVGIFMQITFERLLQSTGKTIYNMITQGLGAIINIILDPILIFGLFGLPRLEVAGAAIATIIGQVIAVLLSFYFNIKKNREISINMRSFRPCKQTISAIYRVGVPSIIMQSIGSITTFGMNKILLMFSSTAATVYGVYFKLQSFIFMPVFGMNNGMIPIIAYKTYYRHNPHEYPDRDRDYGNRSDHFPDHSRLPDESAVQCFRTYAVHRRTGTADYFSQFPVRWILYCSRICIPGTGKWRLQLARICCQTVIRHPSGRIYLC